MLLTGCNEECTGNRNTLPLAGFYSSAAPTQKVRVDSLEVRGLGAPGDSILSTAQETKNELYLPFRIDSDTTTYIFIKRGTQPERSSRVQFVYSRTPRFVSAECGVSYLYDIRKIECSGQLIDSVTCPAGFIDNAAMENIKVYFSSNTGQ